MAKIMNFADGQKEITEGMMVVVTNHQSRSNNHIREEAVTKVGREFVTVGRSKYYLASGREKTEYGTARSIYSSLIAYKEHTEKEIFISKVKSYLHSFSLKLSYEQAQKIAEILVIKTDSTAE